MGASSSDLAFTFNIFALCIRSQGCMSHNPNFLKGGVYIADCIRDYYRGEYGGYWS